MIILIGDANLVMKLAHVNKYKQIMFENCVKLPNPVKENMALIIADQNNFGVFQWH